MAAQGNVVFHTLDPDEAARVDSALAQKLALWLSNEPEMPEGEMLISLSEDEMFSVLMHNARPRSYAKVA